MFCERDGAHIQVPISCPVLKDWDQSDGKTKWVSLVWKPQIKMLQKLTFWVLTWHCKKKILSSTSCDDSLSKYRHTKNPVYNYLQAIACNKVYIRHKWILCSGLSPSPKVSHYMCANISKFETIWSQIFQVRILTCTWKHLQHFTETLNCTH
jgi:hypothetical protein